MQIQKIHYFTCRCVPASMCMEMREVVLVKRGNHTNTEATIHSSDQLYTYVHAELLCGHSNETHGNY